MSSTKRLHPQLSPVLPPKIAKHEAQECILCYQLCNEKQKFPNESDWKIFQCNARKWRGLDKFGTVADTVDWNSGPDGKLWHKICKLNICTEKKLQQAIKRKEKFGDVSDERKTELSFHDDDERPATRLSIGPVHDRTSCIWCMKGHNKRKPEKGGPLRMLENMATWKKIVASIPCVKDNEMRGRLEVLVNGTTDPLTAAINYHSKCYLTYVTKVHQGNDDEKKEVNGKLELARVRELFFNKVEKNIFVEGEPTTLKQLLGEYEQFLLEHGIVRSSLKTCDIRKLMEERFSVRVGFQDRYHRNQSTLVYNKEDGGTFLEAAINCWSVSDERLMEIAGNRLWEKVNSSAETMEWPPQTAAKLCNSTEPHPLLHTFVKSLAGKGAEKTRSECLFLSDVLESHITGKKTPLKTKFAALKKMFQLRLFSDEASIYDKLSRKKRSTFGKPPAKNTDSSNKRMETQAAMKIIDLYLEDSSTNIFVYRLTDECVAIFNECGSIRKCQKSKLTDVMRFKEVYPKGYICIIDMGFIWRLSTPKAEEYVKADESCFTWVDYGVKLFSVIISRHPEAKEFILVNDYYGKDVINVKDGESTTRYTKFSGGDSPNVYPAHGREMPSVQKFKDFFRNSGNKQRLQRFLMEELGSLCRKEGKKMTYCLRGECRDISSGLRVPDYENNKIEADNAIFFIYSQIRTSGETSPVVIDAEDTDVLVTSAYVSFKVSGCLYIKRKKGIFDCAALCDEEMASIAVRFHVMTGCDSISSFFGRGKKSVWNNVKKSIDGISMLKEMSDDSMRKFVIKHIYNDNKSETLAEMRKTKWKGMKKKCFARLGIDEDSFIQRCKRVRYVIQQIENFRDSQECGNPLMSGYKINMNMKCVPEKYSEAAIPDHLRKEIKESEKEVEPQVDNEESNEEENEDVEYLYHDGRNHDDDDDDDDDIEEDDEEEIE